MYLKTVSEDEKGLKAEFEWKMDFPMKIPNKEEIEKFKKMGLKVKINGKVI